MLIGIRTTVRYSHADRGEGPSIPFPHKIAFARPFSLSVSNLPSFVAWLLESSPRCHDFKVIFDTVTEEIVVGDYNLPHRVIAKEAWSGRKTGTNAEITGMYLQLTITPVRIQVKAHGYSRYFDDFRAEEDRHHNQRALITKLENTFTEGGFMLAEVTTAPTDNSFEVLLPRG
jgi:hypothetical protein